VAEVIEDDQVRVRDALGTVMSVDDVDDAIARPFKTVTGHRIALTSKVAQPGPSASRSSV
jgi:hypothetical protein